MLLGASAWSFPPAFSVGKVAFALHGFDAAGNAVRGTARTVAPADIAVFVCPVASAAAASALRVPCSASAARGAVNQTADGSYSVVVSADSPGLYAVQVVGSAQATDPAVRDVLLGSTRTSLGLLALTPPQPGLLTITAANPSASQSRVVLFCGASAAPQPAGAAALDGASCAPDGSYAVGIVSLRVDVFDDLGRPVLSGGLPVTLEITPEVFTGLIVTDNYNGTYSVTFDVFNPAVLSVVARISGAAVGASGAATVVVSPGGISSASTVGNVPERVQAGAVLPLTLTALDRTGLLVDSTADEARVAAFFLPGGGAAASSASITPATDPAESGYSYAVSLPAPARAGPYQVAVQLDGVQVNRGRLSAVLVVAGPPATVTVDKVEAADGVAAFAITVRDVFGNAVPDALFAATWISPRSAITRIAFDSPLWLFPAVGEYALRIENVTDSGEYQLTVTVDGTAVTNTSVVVVPPGLPSALSSYSVIPRFASVGEVVEFTVLLRDSAGRRILSTGLDASLAVVVSGAAFGSAAALVWSIVDEPGLPGVYRITFVPERLDVLTITLFASSAPFAQGPATVDVVEMPATEAACFQLLGSPGSVPADTSVGLVLHQARMRTRLCDVRFSAKQSASSASEILFMRIIGTPRTRRR